MGYVANYSEIVPDRAEIDALPGLLLIEFGVDGCPHCQRAQSCIETAMQARPELRHIKVEDGPGRRLGRTFRVKLWPTLIVMRDGQEIGRAVRPTSTQEISELLAG
ncbi:MAG: thioredoxin family protein [Azonexaceae bacterium]|nr:thioredoxin family protein [Azonexaceae bacterium]